HPTRPPQNRAARGTPGRETRAGRRPAEALLPQPLPAQAPPAQPLPPQAAPRQAPTRSPVSSLPPRASSRPRGGSDGVTSTPPSQTRDTCPVSVRPSYGVTG